MTSDNPRDHVETAISTAFQETDELVTRWVLAAEVIETTGQRSLWVLNPDTMEVWDSLGLLRFAEEVTRRDAHTLDGDDED